jgi:molybdopterin converting factor small subunit
MSITINCFATLAGYAPPGGAVEAASGMTVGSLVDGLRIPREKVNTVFVNGLHAGWEKPLCDGDRVGVFPAVAGG